MSLNSDGSIKPTRHNNKSALQVLTPGAVRNLVSKGPTTSGIGSLSTPDSAAVTSPDSVAVAPTDSGASDYSGSTPVNGSRGPYLTSQKKKILKAATKIDRQKKFDMAIQDFLAGKYKNLLDCSRKTGLPYASLDRFIRNGDTFQGSGTVSKCLQPHEELSIKEHVTYRASIGCGLSWEQLQLLIQVSSK